VLGLGGLVPFVVLSASLHLDWRLPLIGDRLSALNAYAAVILSFLGGARWGLALGIQDEARQAKALAVAVAPSIAAWLVLLAPPPAALLAMAALFTVLCLADLRLTGLGAPPWYAKLRILLSVVAVASMLAAASASGARGL
jgi:hypothetical protein